MKNFLLIGLIFIGIVSCNRKLTIKEKENYIGDNNTVLNSFIISNTAYNELINIHEQTTKIELENKNVLFQKGDKNAYIDKMFVEILNSTPKKGFR